MQRGISLLECLISLVIAVVLISIALPSYQQLQLKNFRTEAQSNLYGLALKQGEYRLDNATYANSLQLGIKHTDRYRYDVKQPSPTTFELVATAVNHQIADVGCLTLTLDQSMQGRPINCW